MLQIGHVARSIIKIENVVYLVVKCVGGVGLEIIRSFPKPLVAKQNYKGNRYFLAYSNALFNGRILDWKFLDFGSSAQVFLS